MGFSAAEADFSVNGLLHLIFNQRQKANNAPKVYCIDPEHKAISSRLRKLGINVSKPSCGDDVETFVRDSFVKQMTKEVFDPDILAREFANSGRSGSKLAAIGHSRLRINDHYVDARTLYLESGSTPPVDDGGKPFMNLTSFIGALNDVDKVMTKDGELVFGINLDDIPSFVTT